MRKGQVVWILSVLVVAILVVSPVFAQAGELTTIKVDAAPTLDGQVDEIWNSAPAISVPVVGGANASATTVSMKSVYTDDSVYFLMQWADPTMSDRREPWQKQPDGSWQVLSTSTTNEENTFYEDKAAFIWDINGISGFAQSGCAVVCHAGEQPAGSTYGNKYTPNPGELGDIWHWKSVRTGPVGQIDDQYLDASRYDPQTATGAGRKSDPNTGGGYVNNVVQGGTVPAFTAADQPAPPYYILDPEKQPFEDTFNPGDEVASIIIAPFQGDRGEINSAQVHSNGMWTLEIGRRLQTGSQFDVQFTTAAQVYPFGVAVFDNAQVNHAVSGVLNLRFEVPGAAAPEPAQPTPTTPAPTQPAPTAPPAAPGALPRTGDLGSLTLLGFAAAGMVLTAAGWVFRRKSDS